ncbi:MAG TPA: hypothetical protein VMX16_18165 [Terriglobia bacterium]|nr:hypothetical protein [Terriglobia bacterium]
MIVTSGFLKAAGSSEAPSISGRPVVARSSITKMVQTSKMVFCHNVT